MADLTFAEACDLLERALDSDARRAIVADLLPAKTAAGALARLRESMRSNVWKNGGTQIALDRFVARYDARTRADGFHALHDWDGKADAVNRDTIAVDVVNFIIDRRGNEPADAVLVAIALDYYFMYLVAMLTLRVWDEGNQDQNLDRVNHLVAVLQGPGGSGQRFADDAATLLLIATSHFELDEGAYDRLLDRARALSRPHRTALAHIHAASLGAHLRFGFDVTYGRDMVSMRNDKGVDYRWLLFALATLIADYADLRTNDAGSTARGGVVEALVGGLSADAAAFAGDPPACLSACAADRAQFVELFHRYRTDLLDEFEPHRPSDRAYSPLSFSFNFSHNILKGIVIDALLWGTPAVLTLHDLLKASPPDTPAGDAKKKLTGTLVGYARAKPDIIRGRPWAVVSYDPGAGRQAFSFMMRTLKKT